MKSRSFDVVIIGLGAVGSSTLYQLSKSGISLLGIDRFNPPHFLGSSHGETRITRLAVGESASYVPIVKRSHEIWREIEALSGNEIFTSCGGVLLDSGKTPWSKHGSTGFLKNTVRIAQEFGIDYQLLQSNEIREKFPLLQIENEDSGYFEPAAGYLRPELAIQSQLKLAEKNGATVLLNNPVLSISKTKENKVQVNLGNEQILADLVINCSGGWIKDFLPNEIGRKLKICRQVLHWMETDSKDWENHPVFMWGIGPSPEDFIYGFPSIDGKSVKMATESFIAVEHPDQVVREVSLSEQKKFWNEKVKGRILGVKPNFLKSEVCFYTVTEDAKFILQKNPKNDKEWMVSACSGHGFKHSAGLGEYLADLVLGNPTRFKLNADFE